MQRILISILISFGLLSCDGSAATLPSHTVEITSLAPKNGKRVQVNVKNMLTEKECISLIEAYRTKAGPYGQVSVHMPSNIKAFQEKVLPWCVENIDEGGIVFNKSYFK